MNKVVLSINADKAMTFVLESVIEKEFEVITVEDVYAAATQLKKRLNIKVIIVDVDNTQRDVWDFIHHVKTSKFYFKPIILLTSNKSKLMSKQIESTGIKYFFYKPFSPSEILKKIVTLSNT